MSHPDSFRRPEPRQIVDWMCAGGVHELEVEQGDFSIHIRLDPSRTAAIETPQAADQPACDAPQEPSRATIIVASDAVGILCDRHPVRNAPFVQAGEPVHAGMTVALIRIGPLYRRFRSSSAGTLVRWLAEPGDRVDFGKPILELLTTERKS